MWKGASCTSERLITKNRDSDYEGMTRKEVIQAWSSNANKGTEIHHLLENYVNKGWDTCTQANYQERLKMFLSPDHPRPTLGDPSTYPTGYDKRYEKYAAQGLMFFPFQDRMRKAGWRPFRTEWIIFDDVHDIAGCPDAVFCKIDPSTGKLKFIVVDWKTRKDKKDKKGYNITCNQSMWPASFPLNPANPFLRKDQLVKDSKLSGWTLQMSKYGRILNTYYGIGPIHELKAVVFTPHGLLEFDVAPMDVDKCLKVYEDYLRFETRVLDWFKQGSCTSGEFPFHTGPMYRRE